jgi:hypothetical protein
MVLVTRLLKVVRGMVLVTGLSKVIRGTVLVTRLSGRRLIQVDSM